jgi:hypothetical protein
MIEDTTTVSFPGLEQCRGLGPIGEDHTRGFLLHSTLAVRWSCAADDAYHDQAQVIGLAWQQPWARDPAASRRAETRHQRHKRAAAGGLESDRWAKGFGIFGGPGQDSGVTWIYVADRESDLYEAFARCRSASVNFVIRATQDRALADQDRALADQEEHLRAALAAGKVMGRREIDVPAGPGRPARRALLEVRAASVTLRGPYRKGGRVADMSLSGLEVKEINPPKGQTPLTWLLLTDLPVENAHDLWKCVAIYRRRWLIEEYHKALKTGVGLEKSQLSDVRKLMALAGILSVVCMMLLDLKLRGRAEVSTPLEPGELDAVMLAVLELKMRQNKPGSVRDQAELAGPWTAQRLINSLARLGGHLARKGDGPPGWMTLWRGWQRLQTLTDGYRLALAQQTCGER